MFFARSDHIYNNTYPAYQLCFLVLVTPAKAGVQSLLLA